MSPRVVLLLAIFCLAGAKPVRKTLNFNMFFLKPQDSTERTVASADGVSRFGPILEYLVQRMQNMMSVRLPVQHEADPAENLVDSQYQSNSKMMPGVVMRPSRTKPGTYEVEIDVVVDEEQIPKLA